MVFQGRDQMLKMFFNFFFGPRFFVPEPVVKRTDVGHWTLRGWIIAVYRDFDRGSEVKMLKKRKKQFPSGGA